MKHSQTCCKVGWCYQEMLVDDKWQWNQQFPESKVLNLSNFGWYQEMVQSSPLLTALYLWPGNRQWVLSTNVTINSTLNLWPAQQSWKIGILNLLICCQPWTVLRRKANWPFIAISFYVLALKLLFKFFLRCRSNVVLYLLIMIQFQSPKLNICINGWLTPNPFLNHCF